FFRALLDNSQVSLSRVGVSTAREYTWLCQTPTPKPAFASDFGRRSYQAMREYGPDLVEAKTWPRPLPRSINALVAGIRSTG
ncbi:MAG: hypothetical protein KDJ54_18655, partial [Candidatus Competibacteraceae bacterium]|nr:hypothetical protein [Candidatus Competibacteraceae bacterium]